MPPLPLLSAGAASTTAHLPAWRQVDLGPHAVVLVLCNEGSALELPDGICEALADFGEHGLDGHPCQQRREGRKGGIPGMYVWVGGWVARAGQLSV